jgi:hypothetical protein
MHIGARRGVDPDAPWAGGRRTGQTGSARAVAWFTSGGPDFDDPCRKRSAKPALARVVA